MKTVKISRGSNDPQCTRVSCGGHPNIGFYCSYRGTREQTIEVLEECLDAMKRLSGELPISAELGSFGKVYLPSKS